jgi:hypothetical protein
MTKKQLSAKVLAKKGALIKLAQKATAINAEISALQAMAKTAN